MARWVISFWKTNSHIQVIIVSASFRKQQIYMQCFLLITGEWNASHFRRISGQRHRRYESGNSRNIECVLIWGIHSKDQYLVELKYRLFHSRKQLHLFITFFLQWREATISMKKTKIFEKALNHMIRMVLVSRVRIKRPGILT